METKPFTLRSHEITKPGGDGTYHIDATYTILKDGQPLGFTEHCNAVARLNAHPKLIEMSRKVHALPFHPSNNGEQWDEGFKRGWDAALDQVFQIADAMRRELGESE